MWIWVNLSWVIEVMSHVSAQLDLFDIGWVLVNGDPDHFGNLANLDFVTLFR